MTVPVNDRRIQYTATASQTVFPYDFRIEDNTSISVLQTVKLTGVTNTLILTTDYTVSNVTVDGGGNITLVTGAAVDDIITITGATPLSRVTDFNQAGDFLTSDLNAQLDSQIRILQENNTETKRTLVLAPEDSAASLTLPVTADRASNFLAFDASGDPIAAAGTTSDTIISAFMETLLDDPTAAAGRATLDAEQKTGSLTAITTLQDADQFIVADNSDSDNSKKITYANFKSTLGATTSIEGLSLLPDRPTLSHNTSDPDHDMDFGSGNFIFSDGSGQAIVSALTKQLDATFAIGDNAGGLAESLTIANDTFYHCFNLSSEDGETTDSGYDTSAGAVNLLADTNVVAAGLTKFEQKGNVITDGSANIRSGILGLKTPTGQIITHEISSHATGTTQIPTDDTKPQITEGNEFISLTIVPTSATSLLEIKGDLFLSSSIVTNLTIALFKDNDVDAISAKGHTVRGGNDTVSLPIAHTMMSGTTSPITFKVRVGGNGAGTFAINGSPSSRQYGGAASSTLIITETK